MAPKRKAAGGPTQQRTIASFFAPSAAKRKAPDAGGDGPAAPQAEAAAAAAVAAAAKDAPGRAASGAPLPAKRRTIAAGTAAAAAAADSPPAPAAAGAPSPDAAAAAIPGRDQRRHARAQAKLVGAPGAASLAEPGARAPAGGRSAAGAGPSARPKYTPLEEQVVALKRQHPDAVLAVEVGYKFRFFGEDAEVAARVLNIVSYPDHNFLVCSIPVPRLPVHVRRLVNAGYKVGVVRQTESAALKAIATSGRSAPFDRRLTALYTAATLDAGERAERIGEEDAMAESQGLDALMPRAGGGGSYLLVLAEDGGGAGGGGGGAADAAADAEGCAAPRVGLVAVDASSGDVVVGEASSGGLVQSGLEAVLLALAPAEVVALEPLSAGTARLLERFAGKAGGGAGGAGAGGGGGEGRARVSRLVRLAGSDYLSQGALERLSAFYAEEGGSGGDGGGGGGSGGSDGGDGGDASASLQLVLALPPLVLRALSAGVEYLKPFGLAGALRDATVFRPLSTAAGLELSSNALQQLELLTTVEGGHRGSLLHLLDRTTTGMGARLLRRWVAAPLADRGRIVERLDAVEELSTSQCAVLASLPAELRRLPDLERAFMRCAHGTASPAEAVAALGALRQLPERLGLRVSEGGDAAAAEAAASSAGVTSTLLARLLGEAIAPAATGAAAAALDLLHTSAARANDYGALFASRERFSEVFERAEAVAAAEAHLHGLLPQLARAAGVPVGRLRYASIQNQGDWLIELPAERTNAPSGWEKVCATKKVTRWHPPEVKAGMRALAVAVEQHASACRAAWQSFLQEFAARHHAVCRRAVSAVAHLDALASLAAAAATPGWVRPQVDPPGAPPRLEISRGRHPTLDAALPAGAVPNDVDLHAARARCAVVTGPNMAGKSVWMRMTAVLAVMVHVGSFVPADAARVGVLDRILTRMGAADDLSTGRSTFAEEMANAAEMLTRATPRSLVLLDELGRGTATRDGIAVAAATLDHLVSVRRCLTLFSTHYRELWRGATANDSVRVWHMGYTEVREEGDSSGSRSQAGAGSSGGGGEQPRLVFLYRLEPGGASHSFGLNVARLAGLPAAVVMRAAEVAEQLEREAQGGDGGRPGSDQAGAEQPDAPGPGAGRGGGDGAGDASLLAACRAALSALRGAASSGDDSGLLQVQAAAHTALARAP